MIDALFGSKTRVKLLHLFLNNPGKAFYVREITRLIDEQINSVRRELANMLSVGIITSDSADNKLYYEVNQRYDYYTQFRGMFADQRDEKVKTDKTPVGAYSSLTVLPGLRVAIVAGALMKGSASTLDILLVGNVSLTQAKKAIQVIELAEHRELTYSILTYDDFYYRLSVKDRFIGDVLANMHQVIVDVDGVIQ